MTKRYKGWPDKLPILDEKDLCRGRYDSVDGRHCLMGWAIVCFDESSFETTEDFLTKLYCHCYGERIAQFNDNRKNSLKQVAKAWNDTIKELGYTVICSRD